MVVEKDGEGKVKLVLDKSEVWAMARYLGRKTREDLAEMETGGRVLPEGFWTAEDLVHRLWEVA